MTQPKVKINRKTIDLTFKVNFQQEGKDITKGETTIRVPEMNLGKAINRAITHIRETHISFHSIG